jgi:hypothetical protein
MYTHVLRNICMHTSTQANIHVVYAPMYRMQAVHIHASHMHAYIHEHTRYAWPHVLYASAHKITHTHTEHVCIEHVHSRLLKRDFGEHIHTIHIQTQYIYTHMLEVD